jgi:hypothetical protein
MSFGDRLIHDLVIERPQHLMAGGEELEDDEYPGEVLRDFVPLASVKGLPQPKSAREKALISQAGVALSDYTVYLFPTDLTSADRIRHVAAECAVADADLPDAIFELTGMPRNAAGIGHHFEVDCLFVASPPVVEGS